MCPDPKNPAVTVMFFSRVQVMNCFLWISSLLCPSILLFFITCLCSCLLGPPASQGAPLLECRCCHCHTCTTHRPSFLPLHSVSPGVQVLLFPFLYSTCDHHTSAYTPHPTHPPVLIVVGCRSALGLLVLAVLYFHHELSSHPFAFSSLILI